MNSLNHSLEITDLRIYPNRETDSKTLAYCIVTFNNALIVSGIRILEGEKGIYVAFPINDTYPNQRTVVYPSSGEARKEISNRILATYVVNHCVDEYESEAK